MRPVDADALMRIHKLETSTIGKDWTVGDLATAIELAPTIPAIPVEWLVNLKNEYARKRREQAEGDLMNLLLMWQKEQEAQDG